MKIKGVSHPIPTKFAERIYNNNKSVFVGKSYLGKVSKGDKFILYESYGEKAYTGWGDIKFIGKMKPAEIIKKYNDKLMITEKEFKDYSAGRSEMNVIEFDNFEKFKKPVPPEKYYVTILGKYIYENEYQYITENKD